MSELILTQFLFDFDTLHHGSFFQVRDALQLLGEPLTKLIETLLSNHGVIDQPVVKGRVSDHALLEGAVYVAEGAEIGPFAYVKGPTYIASGAEIRHGAFIRGSVYIGPNAVVGHTTEVKGSIFFDHAKAGHFAYVGDSVLGQRVNLGAGTKLANLKLKGDEVKVQHPQGFNWVHTGLRKMGALIGDRARTGCNSVLSPGAMLLPDTIVLPCVHHRGTLLKGAAKIHTSGWDATCGRGNSMPSGVGP